MHKFFHVDPIRFKLMYLIYYLKPSKRRISISNPSRIPHKIYNLLKLILGTDAVFFSSDCNLPLKRLVESRRIKKKKKEKEITEEVEKE